MQRLTIKNKKVRVSTILRYLVDNTVMSYRYRFLNKRLLVKPWSSFIFDSSLPFPRFKSHRLESPRLESLRNKLFRIKLLIKSLGVKPRKPESPKLGSLRSKLRRIKVPKPKSSKVKLPGLKPKIAKPSQIKKFPGDSLSVSFRPPSRPKVRLRSANSVFFKKWPPKHWSGFISTLIRIRGVERGYKKKFLPLRFNSDSVNYYRSRRRLRWVAVRCDNSQRLNSQNIDKKEIFYVNRHTLLDHWEPLKKIFIFNKTRVFPFHIFAKKYRWDRWYIKNSGLKYIKKLNLLGVYMKRLYFWSLLSRRSRLLNPSWRRFALAPHNKQRALYLSTARGLSRELTLSLKRRVRLYRRLTRLLKKARKRTRPKGLVLNYSRNNYFISFVSARTGNFIKLFSSGALKHKTSRRRRDFTSLLECWEKALAYLKQIGVERLRFVKIFHKKYLSRIELRKKYFFRQLSRKLKKNRIRVTRWINIVVRAHGLLPRAPKLRRK